MLNVLLLAAAVAQQVPEQPKTPDWRSEFPLRPLKLEFVIRWQCIGSPAISAVSIQIDRLLDAERRVSHRARLSNFLLKGKKAKNGLAKDVSTQVSLLRRIESVDAECQGDTEYLVLKGWPIGGGSSPVLRRIRLQ
jgi:hypothetical protein